MVTTLLSFAPASAKPKRVPGQIVDNNGKVLDVFFSKSSTRGLAGLQTVVVYYDSAGNKYETNADQAQEIRFKIGTKQYKMVSMPNEWNLSIPASFTRLPSTPANIFVSMEIDGPLRLYRVYETHNAPGVNATGTFSSRDRIYLQRSGEMFQVRDITFRKDMKAYLSDCPAVTKQIDADIWGKADIVQIVQTYNLKCGDN